jgi:hypothetical protein
MLAMTRFDEFSLVLATFAVVTNVGLFAAFAVQLRLMRKETESDHKLRRAQATLEFYEMTLAKRISLSKDLAYDRDGESIHEIIHEALAGNAELEREISEYLNLMELLATGVAMDTFDFATIERIAGGGIIAIADHYHEWIVTRRKESDSPNLYIEIDGLAERIREFRESTATVHEGVSEGSA